MFRKDLRRIDLAFQKIQTYTNFQNDKNFAKPAGFQKLCRNFDTTRNTTKSRDRSQTSLAAVPEFWNELLRILIHKICHNIFWLISQLGRNFFVIILIILQTTSRGSISILIFIFRVWSYFFASKFREHMTNRKGRVSHDSESIKDRVWQPYQTNRSGFLIIRTQFFLAGVCSQT